MLHYQWARTCSYIVSKLVGAGGVFFGFIVSTNGMDLYQWSEAARQLPLWYMFYVYAVLYSMAADFLLRNRPFSPLKIFLMLFLYILGGFAPFVLLMHTDPFGVIIAGTVGSVCAVAFWGISALSARHWPYNAAAALLLLGCLLILAYGDFTTTRQWEESRTDTSYKAEFAYFHGKKEVPIELRKGQTLQVKFEWNHSNGGGYGWHIRDEKGDYVALKETGDQAFKFQADEDGTYRIVITGDRLQGSVAILWKIETGE